MNKLIIVVFGLLIGCTTNSIELDIDKSSSTSILIIGIENSIVYGKCPGSYSDSIRMFNLLKNYTNNIKLLTNEEATIRNVFSSLNDAITNELCIVYYSGHGGSYAFNDSNTQLEEDKVDEYLCLYDGSFRDDSIWEIISKSKGRVFLIFDCCHSATMFRSPRITLSSYKRSINKNPIIDMNLLCWSGCPDNRYSYGSSNGGEFTNYILKYFNQEFTYDKLWDLVSSDKSLQLFEKVQLTNINGFDSTRLIFK